MGLLAAQYDIFTGALVRTDPLPVGRYWIDIHHEPVANKSIWDNWLLNYIQSGNVQVESTQEFAAQETVLGMGTARPARTFYIFRVLKPTGWGLAEYVGWPSNAPPEIQSSEDTVQKPPPETPGTVIDEFLPSWLPWAVGGFIVVGGIWGIAKLVRG